MNSLLGWYCEVIHPTSFYEKLMRIGCIGFLLPITKLLVSVPIAIYLISGTCTQIYTCSAYLFLLGNLNPLEFLLSKWLLAVFLKSAVNYASDTLLLFTELLFSTNNEFSVVWCSSLLIFSFLIYFGYTTDIYRLVCSLAELFYRIVGKSGSFLSVCCSSITIFCHGLLLDWLTMGWRNELFVKFCYELW